MFAESLRLSRGDVQGWTFYLTTAEVVFEVAVRLVFAALAGIVAGTLCTALAAPFLWHFRSSRDRIAGWTTKICVILVAFLDSAFALSILINMFAPSLGPRVTTAALAAYLLSFVVVLCFPRARRQVVTSADGLLSEKITRRTTLAAVTGAAGMLATEFVLSKTTPVVKAALAPQRRASNILVVSFDALGAEDMSLYGYKLPTTPSIGAFASRATVFKNFYSSSTFTTASVASMLTGVYSSENHVYQLTGRILGEPARRNLPSAMRAAGYSTAAFISNPYAYFLADRLKAFDVLPEPTFEKAGVQRLWKATGALHQDSPIGTRVDEYLDLMSAWNSLGGMRDVLYLEFPAEETFARAREMLAQLPDGFFLWVHVMTPHSPYHPAAPERGLFIPDDQFRSFEFEQDADELLFPHYEADQQPRVDQRRLAYDEFVRTADRAFGAFISDLETSGRLRNTTVIVSSDHGESFEGGVYQHNHQFMTRPEIHVPLIIRTPGQQEGRTVPVVADQTALAPTILELAGQPKPDWLPGQSLVAWLKGNSVDESGLAFCQYLAKSSVFEPPRYGTVGVIDREYQYVVLLAGQRGVLRPLGEAQFWNVDRAAQNPARAEALRAAIHSRFPDLVQKSA